MNLEINNLNEIIVKVNEGSGIVLKFEADKKCYILTAYHNIETSIENEENLELFSDNNKRYNIIGEYFYDKKNDFALLEVDYINKNIPIVQYNNHILPDDKIIFMGYPDKGEGKRKDLSGKVNEWNSTKTAIKVTDENIQGSFIRKEKTNEVIVGFSGSGVFKKDGQKLSLIGILKSLPEEDFDYKEISCVPIREIENFLNKNIKKSKKDNTITEVINLKNGKSFTLEFVKVKLEDDKTLYVGKYPVTFEEYDMFCEETNKEKPKSYSFEFPRENYPVVNVSWDDAISYCDWLINKSNDFKYTLPSSQIWDKIAKLNKIEKSKLDDYIWHKKNTQTINRVGMKKAGLLGIHDMYGNIWEWCLDNNEEDEYKIIMGNSFNASFFTFDKDSFVDSYLQNESKALLGFRIIKIRKYIKVNTL